MKAILGLSAVLALGLWALCAVTYVTRSRTGSYNMDASASFLTFAAVFTIAAAVLQARAWRRGTRLVAAALTSIVAVASVFVLWIGLNLPGG